MFGQRMFLIVVAVASIGAAAACSSSTGGSSTPATSSGGDPADRVTAAAWVDAVCTGYRETFGSAPTEAETKNPDRAALKQQFLDYLDTQQRAARDASERLDELGAPDIKSRGRQLHRDMIGVFNDIAEGTDRDRQGLDKIDIAENLGYNLELYIISSSAMHPYGLDVMEDNEELDAAATKSAECTAMYDELKHLLA